MTTRFTTSLLAYVAWGIGTSAALPLFAQQWPTKPMRIIVPFPPGGASDVVERTLAAKITESFAQTVIVDNRPGAGSNVGIGIAARAPADGYTLLVVSSAFTVNPSLFANPPYDALRALR